MEKSQINRVGWDPGNALAAMPSVCFPPTASGDADHYLVRFYRHFPPDRCIPSHISLFRKDRGAPDLRTHLLDQDLIYVSRREDYHEPPGASATAARRSPSTRSRCAFSAARVPSRLAADRPGG